MKITGKESCMRFYEAMQRSDIINVLDLMFMIESFTWSHMSHEVSAEVKLVQVFLNK